MKKPMTDELKLEHMSLDEAINYHLTWFEFNVNMLHLADKSMARGSGAREFLTVAAAHAGILAELRLHQTHKREQHAAEDTEAAIWEEIKHKYPNVK